MNYVVHALRRTTVNSSEIRIDPITPKRFEKKMNITLATPSNAKSAQKWHAVAIDVSADGDDQSNRYNDCENDRNGPHARPDSRVIWMPVGFPRLDMHSNLHIRENNVKLTEVFPNALVHEALASTPCARGFYGGSEPNIRGNFETLRAR
jgi:hypothetical protein